MKRLVAVALGVLVTLLLAELGLRVVDVPPRRTVVHARHVGGFDTLGDVTVWYDARREEARRAELEGDGCLADATVRVLVLGDSILNGVSLDLADAPGARLQAALSTRLPGARVCVANLAVPGFVTAQSLARGEEALARVRPHAVVLETYASGQFPARFGDIVIPSCGPPEEAAAGRLANPLGLPAGVHAALLARSRLWTYAHAALPDCDRAPAVPDWLLARASAFADRVTAAGGTLLLVQPARLNVPHAVAEQEHAASQATWDAWRAPRGVGRLRFVDVLPEDPAMAIDPIHLSPGGAAIVAEALADALLPALAEARGGDGAPPP